MAAFFLCAFSTRPLPPGQPAPRAYTEAAVHVIHQQELPMRGTSFRANLVLLASDALDTLIGLLHWPQRAALDKPFYFVHCVALW